MVDKITKAINKFSSKEKQKIKKILEKIHRQDTRNLDIKKLKNNSNIFRVRSGRIRIIYFTKDNKNIKLLTIERRSDNTYNF